MFAACWMACSGRWGVMPQAQGQILDAIRSDVRGGNSDDDSDDDEREPKRKKKGNRSHYNASCSLDDDCDDNPFESLIGSIFFYSVTSPFWVPRGLTEDRTFASAHFLEFPYADGIEASMALEPTVKPPVYPWLLRTSVDYGSDFDSLAIARGHFLLDTSTRWGIDGEVNYRREDLKHAGHDDLWTGDANLLFRFAQSPCLQFRTGIGMNWLVDEAQSDLGFNFTYSSDWYPTDPLVFSSEMDWGWIGDAGLFHFRLTAGVQHDRLEVYTGYDYFDLGSTQINTLVGGLRFSY